MPNLANIPYTLTWTPTAAPASADVVSVFRMPGEGRVLAAYVMNDAAISSATNTVRVELLDGGTAATGTTLIADKPAATAVVADVPLAMTLTAAAQDVASGTVLMLRFTLAGSGTVTNPVVQIDYMLATGPTS